ncbi:MAG: FAD-binding protein [Elusimicrobia bacterium]|nr:FAD-binding protein [Elusimicrobiota bacterium]
MSADTENFLSSGNYKYKINEPLSKHTTLGIGGAADFFVEVDTEEKLISLLKFVSKNKISFFVLGGGSNILFADDGFRGIVIKLAMSSEQLTNDAEIISVSAATSLPDVVRQTAERGLSGFEHLAGIPGTVGGAIFGNAGVKEYSISDNLINIEIIDFNGNKKILKRKNINF